MNKRTFESLFLISLILFLTTASYVGGNMPLSTPQSQSVPISSQTIAVGGAPISQHDGETVDENSSLINMWALRKIYVGDYGLVTVNDTVMVFNNGTSKANAWIFYLPPELGPASRYFAAYGNGTKLDVGAALPYSPFLGMKVDFSKIGGLSNGSSVLVNLIQQYSGLVTPKVVQSQLSLHFYKYLVSPYLTMNYNTSVLLPQDATNANLIFMIGGRVNPFNCTTLGSLPDGGYQYTLTGKPLIEVSVERRLEIEILGDLRVTEVHRLKNIGPTSLMSVRFMPPLSLIQGSLEARDSSGLLSWGMVGKVALVTFRYEVQANWTYTLFVSYRASLDDYRTIEDGLSVIRMLPITIYNCSVDSETLTLVFPPHAAVHSVNQFAQAAVQNDQVSLSFEFKEVTSLNVDPIECKYSDDLTQVFERPIIISLGVFLVGLLYVGFRKLLPRGEIVAAAKEVETKARGMAGTLKDFCTSYEEKTALTLEIEQLAEDRRKGRVSKRAYMERAELVKRRLASLTNSINEAKRKLAPANKRYATLIKQLETYEEERENAKASLDNLDLRRRQGKVSGDVYNRLKYENTRKIEKSTSGIDSAIAELRQEII